MKESSNSDPNPLRKGSDRKLVLREQNIPLALVAGALSATAAGLGWFALSFYAESDLSFLAIPSAVIVAFSIRLAGKGVEPLFGWIGAMSQGLCCLFSIHLRAIDRFADQNGISFLEAFSFIPGDPLLEWMLPVAHPLDLIFCLVSAFLAYRYSFKKEIS